MNVEGSATDGVTTTLDPAGTLVHTNHYVCEGMLAYEDDPDYAKRSAVRFRRGTELLERAPAGSVTADILIGMLSDHENAPDSICRHPDAGSTTKTVFWCVTDVQSGDITYGRGNPCRSTPQHFAFDTG